MFQSLSVISRFCKHRRHLPGNHLNRQRRINDHRIGRQHFSVGVSDATPAIRPFKDLTIARAGLHAREGRLLIDIKKDEQIGTREVRKLSKHAFRADVGKGALIGSR